MSTYKVGIIGGDGIGPEVVAEALKVVEAAGVSMERPSTTWAPTATSAPARSCPTPSSRSCGAQDAILLGAVGPPVGSTAVPPGALERGLLLRLRFDLDLYINLRPFTGVPGALAPDCDFVVIRENTEGTYAGEGGFLRKGTPFEVATQGSVNTRHGVERCVRFAFELAADRPAAPSDPGAQDQRADLRRRPVAADGRRGGPGVPGRHPRLQPRGRHLHLPGRGSRAATTSSSPTICSATSSPTWPAPSPAASATPPRPTSTRTAPGRRCSSRCTARPTTSPAPARPTRPRPSGRPP